MGGTCSAMAFKAGVVISLLVIEAEPAPVDPAKYTIMAGATSQRQAFRSNAIWAPT